MKDRDRNSPLAHDPTRPLRLAGAPGAAQSPRVAGTLELPGSDQVAAAVVDAPGEMIGRFEITGRLGEGGMGVVLAGRDAALGRDVAIKVLRDATDQPHYRDRLLREARAMALLDHPNVIRIFEVGNDRGRVFVAMELVEGTTLAQWARATQRPWREIIAMYVQAGRGLAAVHRAGLVHRDFKPENVLVDLHGHVRVADFGLARLDAEVDASASLQAHIGALTGTGLLLGTPRYMAPEQLAGGEIDARADQFAFCVALREALLRWPATGETPNWRDVPAVVRDALARGLVNLPADRFATMDELLAVLERELGMRPKRAAAFVAGGIVAIGGLVAIAIAASGTSAEPRHAGAPAMIAQPAPATTPAHTAVIAQPATPTHTAVIAQPAPASTKQSAGDLGNVVGAMPVASGSHAKLAPAAPVASNAKLSPREQALRAQEAYELAIASYDVKDQHLVAGATASFAAHPTPFTTATELLYPPVPFSNGKPRTIDRYDIARGHLDAVRTAIAGLGLGGVAISGPVSDDDVRELHAKLDAADTDLARANLLWGLGVAERVRADCTSARHDLKAGEKAIGGVLLAGTVSDALRRRLAIMSARIELNLVLCDLADGHGIDVAIDLDARTLGFDRGAESDEVSFVRGIAKWETGLASGKNTLAVVANRNATLRPIITAYARGVRMIP